MRKLTLSAVVFILALTAAFSLSEQSNTRTAQAAHQQQDDSCVENPPDSYTQEIHGTIDGDEVVLRVSARFGGAVESITWRGKEFINVYDHGRQISYAWQMNGHGECFNPTEPGSASDLFAPSSTTEVLEVCNPAPNILTTKIHPAFWLAPGETGFCDSGVGVVNEDLVSDQTFYKTIEIGYGGIENVIVFDAEITLPESYSRLNLEVPTGYLTYEFTNYWRFNPGTGELTKPESEELVEPWSFVNTSPTPPILATEDGQFAMGAYSADNVITYEILWYDVPNPADRTNKWNIIIHEVPAPAGVYNYQSFAIIGTLEEVQAAMQALYELHPTDFAPPEGYIDLSSCDVLDGWAWDPKTPNQPIDIEIRLVKPDGSETVVYQTTASNYRIDLATALGDNGQHGFSIESGEFIDSGEAQTYRVYALNSNPALSARRLYPQEFSLTCPQYAPTATPEVVEPTEETPATPEATVPVVEAPATPEETAEPESGRPALSCLSGMVVPLFGLALFGLGMRRKRQ